MRFAAYLVVLVVAAAGQSWQPQVSGTTAALHGIAAVNANVAWAAGSKGTFLRTTDGGATWRAAAVPGASDLDFRSVYATDENTAVLLSTGEGHGSRIYRTVDGGSSWNVVYTNGDPTGAFAAIGFWDEAHGILLGEPVKGRFTIMTTADGGVSWHREKGPPANGKEAAGGLFARGTREAWFATSVAGSGETRVFHTTDAGQTWSVSKAPLGSASSIAFSSGSRGVLVGDSIAVSEDGGKTWTASSSASKPHSGVAYDTPQKLFVATGPSGAAASADGGKTWMPIGNGSYNSVSFTADGAGWAVGDNGTVAKFLSAR